MAGNMHCLATNLFGWPDWLVMAGYFLLLLLSGIWFSRRAQSGPDDFFLASRRMPVWAVSFSVIATSLSAATFIGGPQQAYGGDLTYLSANLGGILAALVVAVVFIPAFYRRRVSTVYQLLDHRFGRATRIAASGLFMGGRVLASGARLYIAALAASLILFRDILPWQVSTAIGLIVVAGVLYTLVGGIASVIWTDVIQTLIFIGAACAAMAVLLARIPIGIDEIAAALQTPTQGTSKLKIFELGLEPGKPYLGFDPGAPFTLLTAVFGFTLFNLAAYGTDQDLTQRMLTCRSAARGSWSMICAIIGGIPITAMFMLVGLLLYIFYARPDIMGEAGVDYPIDDSRKVFLTFIINEMPTGMSGLMMAGLFASALSSLNSALNAMAATFVSDFYRELRPDRSDRHYLGAGRIAVVVWGVVLGLFAIVCMFWHQHSGDTLINFSLSVMIFAYSGLLAVFLTSLFTNRGTPTSAIAAMIAGATVTLLLQPNLWAHWFDDSHTWLLANQRIAFPWRMGIATSVAFGVCCLGARPFVKRL